MPLCCPAPARLFAPRVRREGCAWAGARWLAASAHSSSQGLPLALRRLARRRRAAQGVDGRGLSLRRRPPTSSLPTQGTFPRQAVAAPQHTSPQRRPRHGPSLLTCRAPSRRSTRLPPPPPPSRTPRSRRCYAQNSAARRLACLPCAAGPFFSRFPSDFDVLAFLSLTDSKWFAPPPLSPLPLSTARQSRGQALTLSRVLFLGRRYRRCYRCRHQGQEVFQEVLLQGCRPRPAP